MQRVFALTLDELHDPALRTAPLSADQRRRGLEQQQEHASAGAAGAAGAGRPQDKWAPPTRDPKAGRSGKWPVWRGDPLGAEVWGLTAFVLDAVLRELVTPLTLQVAADSSHRSGDRTGGGGGGAASLPAQASPAGAGASVN